METQTIVLVLVSLFGGAALVMLASAFRSINTKVNVTDYKINMIEKERDDNDKFRSLNEELDELRRDHSNELDRIEKDIVNIEDLMHSNISRVDGRIDSRADKIHQHLTDEIEALRIENEMQALKIKK
ncbi:MAG: hypothetical protein CMP57_01915 [Flavobacteriales bacterium]|nr:hypothetical protein [Flavobacteriales bacterium]|tara:strand:- start:779 stop:1162 length:384 start_codon:yes stop_codon:yes gene_type:complete